MMRLRCSIPGLPHSCRVTSGHLLRVMVVRDRQWIDSGDVDPGRRTGIAGLAGT
jgi:hypothetical protein